MFGTEIEFSQKPEVMSGGGLESLRKSSESSRERHVRTAPPADSTMSANLFQSVESPVRDIARACFIFELKAEKVCNYFTSDRNKLWFHFPLWEFRLNFVKRIFLAVRRTRLFASSQMSFHVSLLIVMLSSKNPTTSLGGKLSHQSCCYRFINHNESLMKSSLAKTKTHDTKMSADSSLWHRQRRVKSFRGLTQFLRGRHYSSLLLNAFSRELQRNRKN